MKIITIEIKRFRSIQALTLDLNESNNFSTICGANNAGKTNVLRAINIFFNPNDYKANEDSPNHKFYGSRGGKSYPEIKLVFKESDTVISITRAFGVDGIEKTIGTLRSSTEKKELIEKEVEKYFSQIAFFFIPSINISFPELINSLIEDVYDLEYERTRFRGLKQQLKESFEEYITGTVQILNQLAEEINPVFEDFNENWNVGFEFTSDVQEFRDLISNDIEFYLNDKSNRNIEGKGSGLQRLGYILLHSRIIQKLQKKSVILLIDEPDIYLHHGLQKKLKQHLLDLAYKHQIIISSHSPIFIDSYKLDNVFLLDLEIEDPIVYKRTGRDFFPLSTKLIDLYDHNGLRKIQDYLGIKSDDFELLDKYNILVEGDCDKKYLTELCNYFGIELCKIISCHGVTKFEKYLEFYDSFYNGREMQPTVFLIFDNDVAGRDEYRKLQKRVDNRNFKNIQVKLDFIPNKEGEKPAIPDVIQSKVKSNFEIEDFVYPEILLDNANEILKKRGLNVVRLVSLQSKISANAFKEKGLLYNLDLIKNENNPHDGNIIDFTGEQAKQGISGLFNLRGNKKLAEKISELDKKYPAVKEYLIQIMDSKKMTR